MLGEMTTGVSSPNGELLRFPFAFSISSPGELLLDMTVSQVIQTGRETVCVLLLNEGLIGLVIGGSAIYRALPLSHKPLQPPIIP